MSIHTRNENDWDPVQTLLYLTFFVTVAYTICTCLRYCRDARCKFWDGSRTCLCVRADGLFRLGYVGPMCDGPSRARFLNLLYLRTRAEMRATCCEIGRTVAKQRTVGILDRDNAISLQYLQTWTTVCAPPRTIGRVE